MNPGNKQSSSTVATIAMLLVITAIGGGFAIQKAVTNNQPGKSTPSVPSTPNQPGQSAQTGGNGGGASGGTGAGGTETNKNGFNTTQQQGTFKNFTTPIPTKAPTTTNNLVGCGYGPGDFNCIPSKPKTCLEWNESKTLAASQNPAADGVLHAWYTDEHPLSLGSGTVSPLNSIPDHVVNPNTGDPAGVDPSGRPIRPSLFITDITTDPNSKSGDWENGGVGYDPSEIFGTWKPVGADDPGHNGTNLGPGSIPMPVGGADRDVAEIRWNLLEPKFGLVKGHSYRLEFMLHDGDQTNGGAGGGGDAGEKCSSISL